MLAPVGQEGASLFVNLDNLNALKEPPPVAEAAPSALSYFCYRKNKTAKGEGIKEGKFIKCLKIQYILISYR